MTPRVFCDMDGVVADFETAFADHFGISFNGKYIQIGGYEWGKLQKDWPTFWMDLGYMPHALELWRVMTRYKASLLTACPPSWPSAAVGKQIWARRMLPKWGYNPAQQFIGCQRAEKKLYAKQPDGTPNILVDDHVTNIQEWIGAGGLGIRYIPSAAMVAQVERTIKNHYSASGA